MIRVPAPLRGTARSGAKASAVWAVLAWGMPLEYANIESNEKSHIVYLLRSSAGCVNIFPRSALRRLVIPETCRLHAVLRRRENIATTRFAGGVGDPPASFRTRCGCRWGEGRSEPGVMDAAARQKRLEARSSGPLVGGNMEQDFSPRSKKRNPARGPDRWFAGRCANVTRTE